MSNTGEIRGTVSIAGGPLVKGASVVIAEGPTGPDVSALTDARGNFQFGNLAPGHYAVLVSAEGCEPVRHLVRVRSGCPSRIYCSLQNNVEGEIAAGSGPRMKVKSGSRKESAKQARDRTRGPSRTREQADVMMTKRQAAADESNNTGSRQPRPTALQLEDLPTGSYRIRLGRVRIDVTLQRQGDGLLFAVMPLHISPQPQREDSADDAVQVTLDETGSWILTAYAGKPVLEGTSITAEFEDGRISGNAGCNDYEGTYRKLETSISPVTFSVTERFCDEPEGVMEQESEYLDLLAASSSFTVNRGRLIIFDSSGSEILSFAAVGPDSATSPEA